MKTASDYLEAANAVIPRIPAADAITAYHTGRGVFIDVRDSAEIAKTGTIKGARRIPRGMIEFRADSAMAALFDPVFADKATPVYLVCGAGGQAALAGKTLHDMGFEDVTNIGGFGDWQTAGGPVAD